MDSYVDSTRSNCGLSRHKDQEDDGLVALRKVVTGQVRTRTLNIGQTSLSGSGRELGGHFRAVGTQTVLQVLPTLKAIAPGYDVLGVCKPRMEIAIYDIRVSVQSDRSEIVLL
jgi:hypothetical protein